MGEPSIPLPLSFVPQFVKEYAYVVIPISNMIPSLVPTFTHGIPQAKSAVSYFILASEYDNSSLGFRLHLCYLLRRDHNMPDS